MPIPGLRVPLAEEGRAAAHEAVERSGVLITYAVEGNGSGVLVKVGKRFFVFTAAHCVPEPETSFWIANGIGEAVVELKPVPNGGWLPSHPERVDAAVVEIDPTGCEQFLDARAVHDDKLVALVARQIPGHSVPVLFTGLPGAARTELLPGQPRRTGQIVETTIDGVNVDIPHVVALRYATDGVDPRTNEPVAIVDPAGMSGGGCWTVSGTSPLLIGVYNGRFPMPVEGAAPRTVAIMTLVTAHLALLAMAAPAEWDGIVARWPHLVEAVTAKSWRG